MDWEMRAYWEQERKELEYRERCCCPKCGKYVSKNNWGLKLCPDCEEAKREWQKLREDVESIIAREKSQNVEKRLQQGAHLSVMSKIFRNIGIFMFASILRLVCLVMKIIRLMATLLAAVDLLVGGIVVIVCVVESISEKTLMPGVFLGVGLCLIVYLLLMLIGVVWAIVGLPIYIRSKSTAYYPLTSWKK